MENGVIDGPFSVSGMRITVGDHCMFVSERTDAVVDLSTATTTEYIYNRTEYGGGGDR